MSRVLTILATVVALAVSASSASAQVNAVGAAGAAQSGATVQGIIMRDGGVCDPIRHMGC
jgi:hypothetical protein